MEGRKVSSLSTGSDGSDSSQQSVMNLVLEQVGTVIMTEEELQAGSVSSSGNLVSVLLGCDQVYLAEFRLRTDSRSDGVASLCCILLRTTYCRTGDLETNIETFK